MRALSLVVAGQPVIARARERSQGSDRHGRVDIGGLIGDEPGVPVRDDVGEELEQQAQQRLRGFRMMAGRQDGVADRAPRRPHRGIEMFECREHRVEFCSEARVVGEDAVAVALILPEVGPRLVEQAAEGRKPARLHRARERLRKCALLRDRPLVNDARVVHDEGHEAEPGGVAHAEITLDRRIEPGGSRRTRGRDVLGQVEHEDPQQVGGENLRVIGGAERMRAIECLERLHAEQAIAGKRRRAQEITDARQQCGVRLRAGRERVHDMIEDALRTVAAAEAEHVRRVAAIILFGNLFDEQRAPLVGPRALAEGCRHIPVDAEGAVDLLVGRKDVRHHDEVISDLWSLDAVERFAAPFIVQFENRARDPPALCDHLPHEAAREAEWRWGSGRCAPGCHHDIGASAALHSGGNDQRQDALLTDVKVYNLFYGGQNRGNPALF